MDPKFTSEMKQKLEEDRKNILKQLENFAHKDKFDRKNFQSDYPQYGDKEEDNAVEVAAFQDELSIEGDLRDNLKDIDIALDNVKKGKYGICENCNQPIDEQRLRAYPAARICVKCKSLN